jgi:hypothetical protein
MRLAAVALLMQLMAAGCNGSHDPASAGDSADATVPRLHVDQDRDQDGLCDTSEAELGTDPDSADTDGDGFPDAVEAIGGSDPQDPTSPGPEQLAYLSLAAGALEFTVANTVDGNGEGASGQFNARNAFDRHGLRASDYYQSEVAIDAVPPDNVRGIQPDDGRFTSILGRTRLRFRLQFSVPMNESMTCSASLPFDFAVKSDVGGLLDSASYLLIVTPKAPPLEPQDFCRPVACI